MSIAKAIVKKVFNTLGYRIQSNKVVPEKNSMTDGLERMKQLNINPGTIIDIGAAEGTWTMDALKLWASAKYELIEPLVEQKGKLEQLKSLHPNVNYHMAVAGEAPGEAALNISPDLDGSGIYGRESVNTRRVPIVTIDDIAKNKPGNYIVKFDTHGYELPILKGASETLRRTDLLIIEVYGFRISPTCLLFHELTAYLDTIGFRMIDIVGTLRRKCDNAFWQADAFYLRSNNPVFENNNYI
jgi:FkbM family methyltransferase